MNMCSCISARDRNGNEGYVHKTHEEFSQMSKIFGAFFLRRNVININLHFLTLRLNMKTIWYWDSHARCGIPTHFIRDSSRGLGISQRTRSIGGSCTALRQPITLRPTHATIPWRCCINFWFPTVRKIFRHKYYLSKYFHRVTRVNKADTLCVVAKDRLTAFLLLFSVIILTLNSTKESPKGFFCFSYMLFIRNQIFLIYLVLNSYILLFT